MQAYTFFSKWAYFDQFGAIWVQTPLSYPELLVPLSWRSWAWYLRGTGDSGDTWFGCLNSNKEYVCSHINHFKQYLAVKRFWNVWFSWTLTISSKPIISWFDSRVARATCFLSTVLTSQERQVALGMWMVWRNTGAGWGERKWTITVTVNLRCK